MKHRAKYKELIPLLDVPGILPRRRGKSVHLATCYRWVRRGARGRKLAVVMIGGVIHVSPQALEDFLCGESKSGKSTSSLPSIVDAALKGKGLK